MAYIGKQPVVGNFVKLDAIVTSATATYNLLNGGVAYFPQTANNCIVSLNGVIQSPTSAYTISGSTIVFDSALTSSDSIDFILVLGDVLAIGTPSDGTVTSAKLASGTDGLFAWQSVQTTGFTAVAARAYPCNTTSAAFTVTLPASPSVGDQVAIVDYAGTFATNALTLSPNGNKINGGTGNKGLNTNREGVIITYVDSTQGWVASSGTNYGSQSLDTLPYSIDFLVVAGGGGGGSSGGSGGRLAGGGGGAGGYRTSTQTVSAGTAITITVGDGGAGSTSGDNSSSATGTAGSSSSISGSGLTTISSAGGGGGGNRDTNGANGGSGGAGGGNSATGGTGNTPSTSPSQGNNGGNGAGATNYPGGGGGGAGATGSNATTTVGGNGGNGTASSITGSSVTYAGGGGGGTYDGGTIGSGGTGGGGAGGQGSTGSSGTNGTANLGGGAGGGGSKGSPVLVGFGGTGGKGVVILSMATSNYSGTTTGSPTVTTSGSNTILQFTGSGTYTG